MHDTRQVDHLKNLNGLFGLVVEGNITTVVTCAVLELASNQELQRQLKDELKSVDPSDLDSLEGFAKVKNLKLLHNIYLESLRAFSPAPPIVRFASKAGTIGGREISPRSYLFIPLRHVTHDSNNWENPGQFDPQRHENTSHKINFYPLTPFSTGPRVCPASFGFTEALFKAALVILFKDNQLSLTSHSSVEQIPVNTKEPRLKQAYYGKFHRETKSVTASPVIPFYDAQLRNNNSLRSVTQRPLALPFIPDDQRNKRFHF
jgi:cytochrome P450